VISEAHYAILVGDVWLVILINLSLIDILFYIMLIISVIGENKATEAE